MRATCRAASRSRRGRLAGAETLEFAVCLMILLGVLVIGIRVVQALRLQAEADADARALARQAVICQRQGQAALNLHDVDPAAPPGSTFWPDPRSAPLITVHVVFPPVTVVPLGDGGGPVLWTPRGEVTMRREPGC